MPWKTPPHQSGKQVTQFEQLLDEMCVTINYLCQCGHLTKRPASKTEYCIVGRTNPLKCSKMSITKEKKHPTWAKRSCPDCQAKFDAKIATMRENVRGHANALRTQLEVEKIIDEW